MSGNYQIKLYEDDSSLITLNFTVSNNLEVTYSEPYVSFN